MKRTTQILAHGENGLQAKRNQVSETRTEEDFVKVDRHFPPGPTFRSTIRPATYSQPGSELRARYSSRGTSAPALPYLLQSPGTSVVVVTPSGPVVHVPPAVTLSGFGSLFGGGFNTLLSAPIAANATAAAIAQVRSAEYISKGNAAKQKIDQMNQDAKNAEQNIRDQNIDAFTCEDEFTAVKFNHHLKPADSSVCTLPEEQQAQEAEQELEALNEAGDTSQEAIEAAESAAEAAETAAEAAETAAEAALDAVDILESILETVSLFP